MNDNYVEWLVKRKTPASAKLLIVIAGGLTAVAIFAAMLFGTIGMIVAVVFGGITYFLKRNADVEYEYLLIGNQFSVDKIFGKTKRKNAWEGTLEEVQMIAPSDSYILKDYKRPNAKVLDFSSGNLNEKTYTMMCQSSNAALEVILEPNDKLIQGFRQVAPRKIVM